MGQVYAAVFAAVFAAVTCLPPAAQQSSSAMAGTASPALTAIAITTIIVFFI
jgi:hypothetical protein